MVHETHETHESQTKQILIASEARPEVPDRHCSTPGESITLAGCKQYLG